jgi:hypothetical protein
VVGGANAVGILSALGHAACREGDFHEAEGAAFVLLESERSLRATSTVPLCRITSVTTAPFLSTPPDSQLFQGLLEAAGDAVADGVVMYGGSPFRRHADAASEALAGRGQSVRSRFAEFGCLGAASVACDLAAAAGMIAADAGPALCLNRDLYGRESGIGLRRSEGWT